MRFAFLVLVACSGSAQQIQIGAIPPRATQGVLYGPLCHGDTCKCRELNAAGDGGAGMPEDKKKRFEIRLQSAHELWASVGGTNMYKSPEQPEACFYIDLAPGAQPFQLRASHDAGVSAAVVIRELGAKTKSWYDTFSFNCGHPGSCAMEELAALKTELENHKHHVMDMCGSVKIKGLQWATSKGPDQEHPGELQLELVLDIYKRVPTQAHGDPACGKGPPPKDEPPPEPEPAPAP
jgi:hypothetical protein